MPLNPRGNRLFTLLLTNADSPFTIKKDTGAVAISIQCTSITPITIQGTGIFQGMASQPIPFQQSDIFNYTEANSVEDYEIVIPAGATAQIIGFI